LYRKVPGDPVRSRQIIHYLVSKLKTGSLLNKKADRKLTEETLDDVGARLGTLPRKSL
jgi:hypothetical protein